TKKNHSEEAQQIKEAGADMCRERRDGEARSFCHARGTDGAGQSKTRKSLLYQSGIRASGESDILRRDRCSRPAVPRHSPQLRMARVTGLEPATSGVTGREEHLQVQSVQTFQHLLRSVDKPRNFEH